MKRISLVVLGVVSLVVSRVLFALIDDPEGPNLLVVVVLAAIICTVCVAGYFCYSVVKTKWVER